jgi:hypothetical protein
MIFYQKLHWHKEMIQLILESSSHGQLLYFPPIRIENTYLSQGHALLELLECPTQFSM